MVDFSSLLEGLRDAGITLPEGVHGVLSWCAALVLLFVLMTMGGATLAMMLWTFRQVRVASHRLFEPLRPRQEGRQLIQLLREILGADKRR
jgi:hypothetical protein